MSTWFPIGPDFVYATRDPAVPMRLSRRNEWARQAKVKALAVDPTATPPVLYTVEQPYPQATDNFPQTYPQSPMWPVGGSAFCSQDDGWTWTSIADSLILASPGLVPTCIAVHPAQPNYIYLGTASGEIYVSTSRGAGWGPPQSLGSGIQIVQIVVDPRGASSPATTTLYAATTGGLQISTDGGAFWLATSLMGWVMCLAFNMPTTGTADLYAGVQGVGLYYATDAAGSWTLLNGSASGLPAPSALNFTGVLVDFCRQNPKQVYVVLGPNGGPINLYASPSGPSGFAPVASASAPNSDLYRFAFAVAPNSPGDGATDILIFSGVALYRSNTAGTSWDACADDPHGDHNCFGFSTLAPTPGEIPTIYVGCDGGLFASTSLADGTVDVTVYPSDFSDGLIYTPSGVAQNYNHAKLSLAVRAYAADPTSGAYGYTGAQDTGLAGHIGTLGWRGLDNWSDVWGVAARGGSGGLTVWYWTPFDTRMITDQGQAVPAVTQVNTSPPPTAISGCSTMRVAAGGLCLTGAYISTELPDPISMTGVQAATPVSMLGIVPGVVIVINAAYAVTVISVTATTFTADFPTTYAANAVCKVFSGIVFAIDQTGLATQVSQVFGSDSPKTLAAHPTDATFAACATGTQALPSDQRVWMTSGVPLTPTTVWTEIAGPTKPSGGLISALAVDSAGHIYVLLTDLTWTAPGGGAVTTPLYEVSTGSWVPQPSSGLPAGQFGSLVIHPSIADTLYASSGGQVYQLTVAAGTWTWTQVGSGLPGQNIVDLWIGDVGASATPKVLLRAAVVARGVWEADVTSGAGTTDPPTRPYMRHQPLDLGWLVPSLEGQVDPFSPSSGPSLYHWESPDIKVDAQQPGSPNFYQNEPEDPLALSHVAFDELINNSQNLPESDSANVHVQVNNRSYTALSGVAVWAIWTNCSAGVPSLARSPSHANNYNFWDQFLSSGAITPGLPSDSPWRAVGPPTTISNLVIDEPQIASFPDWTIPTLGSGDPGHYCIVAFVHSAENPINETSMNVDAIATDNPQVAQRNLHITTMAPMDQIHRLGYGFRDYIEFHNPGADSLLTDFVFDFRELPDYVRAAVQLTPVATRRGLKRSIVGGAPEKELTEPHECVPWLRDWADRFRRESRRKRRVQDDSRFIPRFAPRIYEVYPANAFEVREVEQGPFETAAALFVITTTERSALWKEFRFRVLQRVRGRVVGGSTYVIRPALQAENPAGPPPFAEPPFPQLFPAGERFPPARRASA